MSIALNQLVAQLDDYLRAQQIADYCPNGLQVEGKPQVKRIISGVTASQALIDAAIEQKADAVLVHHGFFWKGENPCLVGMKYRRIKALIDNDISLLAYHLPLDIHPEVGNNVQLARRLGLKIDGPLDPNKADSVGLIGHLTQPISNEEFSHLIGQSLEREPLTIVGSQQIKTVAWCTGAAQGYMELAINAGVDAFITGEISEHSTHSARENGISYFAAGHHATERYGVQALGQWLEDNYDIEHTFIECHNPV